MAKVDMKVVLLGKEYGGKTCLAERFLHDRFRVIPYQNTIGAAYGAKKIIISPEAIPVMMGIWDTAGSERYESMSRIYYRGAWGAIVCYDLTDSSSFDRAKFWIEEVRKHEETCRIYLCGTKKDLVTEDRSRRQVDFHNVYDYADEIGSWMIETSSKTGENVYTLFDQIASDYGAWKKSQESSTATADSTINLSVGGKMRHMCCS